MHDYKTMNSKYCLFINNKEIEKLYAQIYVYSYEICHEVI